MLSFFLGDGDLVKCNSVSFPLIEHKVRLCEAMETPQQMIRTALATTSGTACVTTSV